MKEHLIIILLAIFSLFPATNGFPQEEKGSGAGDIVSKTVEGQRINAFAVGKIKGSKVINMKGETLGKIEDLVVDIDTGRIVYAILEPSVFLGINDKLFPVPWESLAALPSEGIFFLNQSKEQMKRAPSFDKYDFPYMGYMSWGANVLKYYGAPSGYVERGPLGFDYGYYGSNYPISPGSEINAAPRIEDPYKNIFDPKTIETITGDVIKKDQVPEFRFGLQMRLTVLIDKKEILPVYLGPASYLLARGFKLGDQVTVSGSRVTVRGEPLMIAITVKRRNEVLRLRDEDGFPAWTGWKKTSD